MIFHLREADLAERVIVDVDRRAARAGTLAPPEPVTGSSNRVYHPRAPRLPERNRDSALPGFDLGRRERRIVKIPAIQVPARVAIADRRCPRQQRAGGSIVSHTWRRWRRAC
jgi:hypothetical protein